jgi:hypothetical protein
MCNAGGCVLCFRRRAISGRKRVRRLGRGRIPLTGKRAYRLDRRERIRSGWLRQAVLCDVDGESREGGFNDERNVRSPIESGSLGKNSPPCEGGMAAAASAGRWFSRTSQKRVNRRSSIVRSLRSTQSSDQPHRLFALHGSQAGDRKAQLLLPTRPIRAAPPNRRRAVR